LARLDESIAAFNQRFIFPLPFAMKLIKINLWNQGISCDECFAFYCIRTLYIVVSCLQTFAFKNVRRTVQKMLQTLMFLNFNGFIWHRTFVVCFISRKREKNIFLKINFFFGVFLLIVLLLSATQQAHRQKPPVYTAESAFSSEKVFCFFLQSQNKLRSNKAI
jgi:hypothetical protein